MTLHNVWGITGPFGSGKSLYAVQMAVKYADKFKKKLVFNFPVNEKAIREYARVRGFKWVAGPCRIITIEVWDNLMDIWKYTNSVLVFDEAGIFTNSRAWASTPTEFLRNLFQVRKLNVHLIMVFQFESQIDKQMRLVCQQWARCKSWGYYSERLEMPRITGRFVWHYSPEKFDRLMENAQARGNIVLPWLWSNFFYWRFLIINQLYARLCWLLQELLFVLVYVTTNKQIKRGHSGQALEDYLFQIFKSNRLVGSKDELPSPKDLKRFYTEADFYGWVNQRQSTRGRRSPTGGLSPSPYKRETTALNGRRPR
jgi:hypothetical protein